MFSAIALTVSLLIVFATHSLAKYISVCGRLELIENPETKMPMLGPVCETKSGRSICTSLAIKHCYVNLDGHLSGVTNGNYQGSCINCHLEGELQTNLVCDCKGDVVIGKAEFKSTSIVANINVDNTDGLLSRYGHQGTECRK